MADRAAKQEQQAMECAQLETRRKAELERIAQATAWAVQEQWRA